MTVTAPPATTSSVPPHRQPSGVPSPLPSPPAAGVAGKMQAAAERALAADPFNATFLLPKPAASSAAVTSPLQSPRDTTQLLPIDGMAPPLTLAQSSFQSLGQCSLNSLETIKAHGKNVCPHIPSKSQEMHTILHHNSYKLTMEQRTDGIVAVLIHTRHAENKTLGNVAAIVTFEDVIPVKYLPEGYRNPPFSQDLMIRIIQHIRKNRSLLTPSKCPGITSRLLSLH